MGQILFGKLGQKPANFIVVGNYNSSLFSEKVVNYGSSK